MQRNVPLYQYTTLHIGGVADYVCKVTTEAELVAACQFAKQTDMPLLILGGGSNVLISDDGFRGLVVINAIRKQEVVFETDTTIELRVGSGDVLDDVVALSTAQGWWGLENLSAIPGTVGATPVQNVGAYGVEVASLITSVTALHCKTLEKKIFTPTECQFGYRDSFFKTNEGKQWVITEVVFRLSTVSQPQVSYADLRHLLSCTDTLTPTIIRNEVIKIRSQKFPDWSVIGTAGSFFKNPIISHDQYMQLQAMYHGIPGFSQSDGTVKVSLGYILDKVCGLRGYTEGNVGLFEKQALVLIAQHGATATEVKTFVKKIEKTVFEKTNIHIMCEVQFI